MTIRPAALMFLVSIVILWAAEACAQTWFKDVKVGHWTVEEEPILDSDNPEDESAPTKKPTGRPNSAYTPALNRPGELFSFKCSEYEVVFYFNTNDANFHSANGESLHIFTKVDSDDLYPTELHGAETTYFYIHPISTLIRGANFMICPTRDDKNPLCFTFSLKGFTAALKMVCPKR
jgi:hypothetical protein